MLDLIWGIATLEADGRRGGVSGYANTRQPSDQLEKTMACTGKTARSLAVLAGPNEIGFATHLYEYRRTSERGRSRQAHRALRYLDIPDCAKLGYPGEFRDWEHRLRVGE